MGGKQPDKLEVRRGAATEGMRREKRRTAKITSGYGKSIEYKKQVYLLDKELFFEKFFRWVKESDTRECYYYVKEGKIHAYISTPDEDFKLEIPEKELTLEELRDLREFGQQTLGTDDEKADKMKEPEDGISKTIEELGKETVRLDEETEIQKEKREDELNKEKQKLDNQFRKDISEDEERGKMLEENITQQVGQIDKAKRNLNRKVGRETTIALQKEKKPKKVRM
jgi:hypothetical protein